MATLDATTIKVRDRQRRSLDLDDNFVKSVNRRLIHPIVVRQEEDGVVLVAGGMRLAALIKGGTTTLIEGTHFRFMDDLSPLEAKIVELEENVKRTDLPWRDHAQAIGDLHKLYSEQHKDWTAPRLAAELNISNRRLEFILSVYKNLDSPSLKDAKDMKQAHGILQNQAERKIASIVTEITQAGQAVFNSNTVEKEDDNFEFSGDDNSISVVEEHANGNGHKNNKTEHTIARTNGAINKGESKNSIICADFLEWIKTYSGPKFNLIHCDFPFGIGVFTGTGMKPNQLGADTEYNDDPEVFFTLLNCFCDNIDKIASYSSHIMFWFSMNYYEKTRQRLSETGLLVLNHPLIWNKSDNAGMVPGHGNHPRRTYETAFLCSFGQRPLSKKLANCYNAPSASNPIVSSQKSEPVLKHFFSMLIDETTDVFDPTAGSGAAIRVAESLGARSVLGLEINQEYTNAANVATETARQMRNIAL